MKPVQSRRLAFAALLSLSFSSASCHAATEHWGWIEQSWLMPERMQAKAKLDTGALTSSLDARNIHRYRKDGERWVRFDVVLPTADSKAPVSVTFERKVLRLIKVRAPAAATAVRWWRWTSAWAPSCCASSSPCATAAT